MSGDRDSDTPFDETVAATADPAPATGDTVAASTAQAAIGTAPGHATAAVDSRARTPGGGGIRSTVGNEMRGATIDRFTIVGGDRFELLDELARGGLGRVFRARDPRTGRIVAIKEVLRPQPEIILRFAREALVTSNLQHPSIVPVYEVGRWPSGEPFYAMKLVEGQTLETLIKEATTTEQRVALLSHVIDIADALAYAHAEHVIHRDLKPANVLVGAYGETVVIDWGLAKNVATGEELEALPTASTIPPDQGATVDGAVVGTPAYMAPEQAIGEKIDERADVYAIGAILYHALGGARPFLEARTLDELMEMVAHRSPRPLAELAPDLPAELIAIVTKAMARDPRERYPTAQELALDLRRFQTGNIVGAHRYTPWQLVRRWIANHRATVLTAAIAFVVLVVVTVIGVRGIARERDEAEAQTRIAEHERAEAAAARDLAEHRFADSLEELARQALLANAPDRALPLVATALAARRDRSPILELIGARATTAFAGLAGIAPAPAAGPTSGFVREGRWLISADKAGNVRSWDLAAGKQAWETKGARLIEPSVDTALVLGVEPGFASVRSASDGKIVRRWPLPPPVDDLPSVLAWSGSTRFALATPAGRVLAGAIDAAELSVGEPHQGPVYGMAFSPDGSTLATAGADGLTGLRDPVTAKLRERLTDGAPSELATVVWLDDRHAATGDNKGVARIWNTAEHRVERRLQHPSDIYGIAVGPDHHWIATYGQGTVVVAWNPTTGAVLSRLDGHVLGTDVAGTVGDTLITTDETGSAFAWDPMTGQRLVAFPNEGAIHNLGITRGGIALIGTNRLRAWHRIDEGVTRLTGHTARVRGLEFSIDGSSLWSASNDGTARGVELSTGKVHVIGTPSFSEPPLAVLPQTPPPINPHGLRSLRPTPDGTAIATLSEDGTIALHDVRTGALRATWLGHTARVRQLVFSRDGRTAFSVGDTTLRRWDVATGKQSGSATLPGSGWDVALFDNDRVVATLTDKKRIAVFHTATFAPIATPDRPYLPAMLIAAGDRMLIADDTHVAVLDATGSIVREASFTLPESAALGPPASPRWLAVGGRLGDTTLYAWPTLEPIRSWRADQGVIATQFSPDGTLLAATNARHALLWDPMTGRLLAELESAFVLTQVAWSPDGHKLAAAGASGTVLLWDLTPPDPAKLAAFAACVSPWQVVDSVLVARPFDATRCAR